MLRTGVGAPRIREDLSSFCQGQMGPIVLISNGAGPRRTGRTGASSTPVPWAWIAARGRLARRSVRAHDGWDGRLTAHQPSDQSRKRAASGPSFAALKTPASTMQSFASRLLVALVIALAASGVHAAGFQRGLAADPDGKPLEFAVWYPSAAMVAPVAVGPTTLSVAVNASI